MKTTMMVEFETKKMRDVIPEEYMASGKKCPKEELMTAEIEDNLHSAFDDFLRSEKLREAFESAIEENCDVSVEGFESLDDYGTVTIKVKKLEAKR